MRNTGRCPGTLPVQKPDLYWTGIAPRTFFGTGTWIGGTSRCSTDKSPPNRDRTFYGTGITFPGFSHGVHYTVFAIVYVAVQVTGALFYKLFGGPDCLAFSLGVQPVAELVWAFGHAARCASFLDGLLDSCQIQILGVPRDAHLFLGKNPDVLF